MSHEISYLFKINKIPNNNITDKSFSENQHMLHWNRQVTNVNL